MPDYDGLPGEELHVLTWLDDLYDTRLSVLMRHDMLATLKLLEKGYDTRIADNLIWTEMGFSKEDWEKLWEERDEEILAGSVKTAVPDFLRELAMEQIRQPITPGVARSPISLTINTYPYYISKEVEDALQIAYKEMIFPLMDVKFIRRSYEQLSPAFVMSRFTTLVHYDYDKWAVVCAESKEPASMTLLNIIGPRIFKDMPTDEDYEVYAEQIKQFDLHMLAEIAVSLTFQLNLVPVDLWVAYKTKHSFTQEQKDMLFKDDSDSSVPESI